MKKLFAGVLAAALALSVLTASAFAAPGANYVDADGDGVCDNCLAGKCLRKDCRRHCGGGARQCAGAGCRFVDEDGDGICDLLAAGGGGCGSQRYVDNNGDGVCDNFAVRPQDGIGCQRGHGGGHRQGGHHGGRGR